MFSRGKSSLLLSVLLLCYCIIIIGCLQMPYVGTKLVTWFNEIMISILSALWVLMAWCSCTRPSAAAVLNTSSTHGLVLCYCIIIIGCLQMPYVHGWWTSFRRNGVRNDLCDWFASIYVTGSQWWKGWDQFSTEKRVNMAFHWLVYVIICPWCIV